MKFETYLATLPPPKDADIRADRRARKERKPRNPLATGLKRLTATRLVKQAETKLGTSLETTSANWPKVIDTLRLYSSADWRDLRSSEQLIPKAPAKKAPGKPPAKADKKGRK